MITNFTFPPGLSINTVTAKYKYCGQPIAEYLHVLSEGDEATGSTEWAEHVQRFGKRLLFTDDQGFVTCKRYPTEDEAKACFGVIDSKYCEWLDANDEESY
jgi:hypothetical protein